MILIGFKVKTAGAEPFDGHPKRLE